MELYRRSVYCGEIKKDFVGKEVFLSGWVDVRRDLGGLIFIDLRDRTGVVQIVFNPEKNKTLAESAQTLRSEFVICVRGNVLQRSSESVNKKIKTGEFEVEALDLSIISESKTPPFEIEDDTNASEELRLTYRYLDLRRPKMHNFIKMRHEIAFAIREFLNNAEFYEIETPILSKSTPEGARDFLVPSRQSKGKFYALPQSPQIYKQLLMSAGMEKYFQIARCFRDEDLRANRQPEFTQLDLEMSFVGEEKIQTITEGTIAHIAKKVFKKDIKLPFERMKYDEAFARFGTDAPDIRFEMEIKDLTSLFETTEVKFLEKVIEDGGKVGAIVAKDCSFSKTELKKWEDTAKKHFGASGLLWIKFNDDGTLESPMKKFLPKDFFAQVRDLIPTLSTKDIIFIVADDYEKAWTALGRLRVELAKALNLTDESKFNFLWITHFPLLEWDEETERWYAKHHPFTLPQTGFEDMELKDIKSHAYDLVCNGEEIGGGSLRIYKPEMQMKMFKILGISQKEAEEQFGFLLKAQEFGFPPHGGIALGLDRIAMTFLKTDSIRDVIAFPKTSTGACLMTQSPSLPSLP
jgi:aspartyl-tRNA synthetase